MVFVDQPTGKVAPLDRIGSRRLRLWHRAQDIVWTAKTESSVRSMRLVMLGVLPQDTEQVSSTQDQHVIEHLPAYASDQSLGVSVGLRGSIRGKHDIDAFGGEHRIEAERVPASRSLSRNRTCTGTLDSSRSIIRLRACRVTHVLLGGLRPMLGEFEVRQSGRERLVTAVAILVSVAVLSGCQGSVRSRQNQGTPTPPHKAPDVDHDSVVRVDPASGVVQAVVSVGPDPLLMDVASEQVWTLNLGDGTLSRIDPATNRATSVSLGEAVGMTSDGEDLWVAVDGSTLVRIDGATGEEQASLRLGARPLFALRDAGFPAVGGGAIWLTVPKLGRKWAPHELWRIDPASGRVVTKIGLGPNSLAPFSSGRYLWIITMNRFTGDLTRIDTSSNDVMDVPVGAQPWGLAVGAGSLWVGHQSDREVWRLDPETGEPTAKVPISDAARGVGFGSGLVWVTTETALISIDPATNEVSRTIELMERTPDEGPIGVVYVDGSVWVSVE